MTATNDLPVADTVVPPPADEVVATSKHWGILLTSGILTGALGAVIIAWPEKTVAVAGVLLGISLLISGVFGVVASFTQPDQTTSSRVLVAISGVISLALGLIAFQGITQAVAILVIVVGIGWLMRGVIELVAGIAAQGVPGRGVVITSGAIGIAGGVAIMVWPSITLTVLCWIVGLTLLLVALIQIVGSLLLRSAGKRAQASVTVGEVLVG